MKLQEVKGYEGLYKMSESGEVFSIGHVRNKGVYSGFYNGKKLVNKKTTHGYLYVSLYVNGKSKNCPIHRLVALNFIPNPDNLPCINHKDGNKLNNSISNLEWCTQPENIRHAFKTGLNQYMPKNHPSTSTPIVAKDCSGKIEMEFPSMMQAKRDKGYNASNIFNSIKNKRLGYGYYWEYKTI